MATEAMKTGLPLTVSQLAPLFFCGHHQHNNSLCLIPVAMAASESKHLLLLLLLKVIPVSN